MWIANLLSLFVLSVLFNAPFPLSMFHAFFKYSPFSLFYGYLIKTKIYLDGLRRSLIQINPFYFCDFCEVAIHYIFGWAKKTTI